MRPVRIVDTETTNLNPSYYDGSGIIWELCVLEYGSAADPSFRRERLWRMEPNLAEADETALSVGRYYERTAQMLRTPLAGHLCDLAAIDAGASPHWSHPAAVAKEAARLLDNATVVAAVPSFDAGYLRAMLRHHGQAATWHYRLRDIGSMAYGYLRACLALGTEGRDAALGCPDMDASTDDFALALGLDPGAYERHSALGDCRLVAAMLDVITGAAR